MKKQLIKIIAEYLEKETNVTAEYGSQRIEFGGVLNQGHFTHAGFCKEVAEELAAAIAPHLEAGSDWENAPEWAGWRTVDKDGTIVYWDKEPYLDEGFEAWRHLDLRVRFLAIKHDVSGWENTLQKRPK